MILKLKNQLLIGLLLCCCNILLSQTGFEKGVFITNSDVRVECFIKNIDWKNNPTEFKYKLTEAGDVKSEDISKVKSFEIYGESKFIRATVDLDRSSNNVSDLTVNKNPKFEKKQLFLKMIIEGQSNLYYYEDDNLRRFFYNADDSIIKPLVYKIYLLKDNLIGENNHFRQQLFNTLKCEGISKNKIIKLDYNKNDLSDVFQQYNACIGNTDVVNYHKKSTKNLFNFRVKLGLGLASLSLKNTQRSRYNVDFDNEFIYRFGGELEMVLPFNNNKWAIVIEPSYQSYSSKKNYSIRTTYLQQSNISVESSYSSIEIPFGVRHYFYLNEESNIFVNAFYSLILTSDSKIDYSNSADLEIGKTSGQSVGVGYNYKKVSLEFRYDFPREILEYYTYRHSDYRQINLILGYQIF